MKLDEFFRCVGGGYGEAKARFQNDERIVRFLNMFPGDDSMQNLTNAMNTGGTSATASDIRRATRLRRSARCTRSRAWR